VKSCFYDLERSPGGRKDEAGLHSSVADFFGDRLRLLVESTCQGAAHFLA
jgi:hypothetical protein